MKNLILALGLLTISGTAFALPKPNMTCKSIDITHRPYYKIQIYQFDITHSGYYGVVIEKLIDLAGTTKETISKEGPGKVTSEKFSVDFGDYKNGIFIKSGVNISGFRLANGYLKGEMNLGDDRAIELACQ